MLELWSGLSVTVQDGLVLLGLLVPLLVLWLVFNLGFAPGKLVRALLRRYLWVNLLFIGLIAVSVGMSIAVIAQERALRVGSATAADKFDLVVGAPGSELTMLFASVYLQPSDVPLIMGSAFDDVARHERAAFAAPLAFGDSYQGAPIVGTTADFVSHLTGGAYNGELWETPFEALVGADLDIDVGHVFVPAHGVGDAADDGLHGDEITVVGRLPATGSPWDRAILTPVEGVWLVHALGTGKALGDERLGPPYDPDLFPGTPAIIVSTGSLSAAYALQAELNNRVDLMAFFPGTVLARLHNVLGDIRGAMSVMSAVTQVLVAASVLTGLFILTRLYRRQLVLLRMLGAPTRFIMGVVWSQAMLLLAAGALAGIVFGVGTAAVLSAIVSEQTGMRTVARIGWSELQLAATFLSASSILAVALAAQATRSAQRDDGVSGH